MKLVILQIVLALCMNLCLCEPCNTDPEMKHKAFLSSGNAKIDHYNIILLGATGNLAAKYLWKAFYTIFRQHYSQELVKFQIYATSRKEPYAARKQISRLLLALVDCENGLVIQDDPDCMEHKKKFIESIQYHQLKTEQDFQILSDKLYENTQSIYGMEPGSPSTYERGRLIYMSIPPSTYGTTAKYIHKYLRPKIGRPWMRVIVEKPFGHNFESARDLAAELAQYFSEAELYRIDHYLAKTTVKQILPFRYKNREILEPLWNRDYIEQVEVVMKEKEDVSGRTDFYNDVGVIRDVMQNHMTEMLALIACDLPADSGNISSLFHSKQRLLKNLRMAGRGSVLTGQYTTYNVEWIRGQLRKLNTTTPPQNISRTPTHATVVLNIATDRWRDVPFILTSGKKLDEKASYIRIRFRPSRLCLRSSISREVDESFCTRRQEVMFLVGDGSKQKSLIAVSDGLPMPKAAPLGWNLDTTSDARDVLGRNASELVRYIADVETDPYVELIEAAMTAGRHMFVSTDCLLAAWKVWTEVINAASRLEPRQYIGQGKDSERLDVFIAPPGSTQALRYWVSEVNVPLYETVKATPGDSTMRQVPDTFRSAVLVSGTRQQVITRLTQEISRLIDEKVSHSEEPFHLALSGGQTPEPLMRQLASASLPWQRIHIWLVDERCDGSNFDMLQSNLISRIAASGGIPHRNVHPMLLADLADDPCDPSSPYRLDAMYETAVRRRVSVNGSFDFVVLGLGTDGHTASLFPGNSDAVNEQDRLVTMTEHGSRGRITLTLAAINRASSVAVLVTGSDKNAILRKIGGDDDGGFVDDATRYPITGVKLNGGKLGWYIDYDAVFGSAAV